MSALTVVKLRGFFVLFFAFVGLFVAFALHIIAYSENYLYLCRRHRTGSVGWCRREREDVRVRQTLLGWRGLGRSGRRSSPASFLPLLFR